MTADEMIAAGKAALADLDGRCLRCGWPLAESREHGCVRGNCSWRGNGDPTIPKQVVITAELLDGLVRAVEAMRECGRR